MLGQTIAAPGLVLLPVASHGSLRSNQTKLLPNMYCLRTFNFKTAYKTKL